VTEERKVAMLAAGSALLRRHWDAICLAVEGSTSRDADPKTNEPAQGPGPRQARGVLRPS